MSQTLSDPRTKSHADEHGDEHVAHQFENATQQMSSAKLGMWAFLATELLMFGGLFCAYAVYRGNHPEVFKAAADKLNWWLGSINTLVLIASSLTMAWAVRNAMLNQRKALVINLILTFLGGAGFMVIKYIEYSDKIEHHKLWGLNYTYHLEHPGHAPAAAAPAPAAPAPAAAPAATPAAGPNNAFADVNRNKMVAPPAGPMMMAPSKPAAGADDHGHAKGPEKDLGRFFTIYYAMTGLHGIHVLVGMGLIAWIAVRSMMGHFSSSYYTPVDLVGLYWHLVDLIWIFLFPLLYLIH